MSSFYSTTAVFSLFCQLFPIHLTSKPRSCLHSFPLLVKCVILCVQFLPVICFSFTKIASNHLQCQISQWGPAHGEKILTINVWMAFEATVMQGKITINTWNQLFILFFLRSIVSNKLEVLLQKAGISTFYCNMNLNVYSSVLHSAFSLMAAG